MIFATNRQRIKIMIDNESINSVRMRKASDKDAFFSTLAQKKKSMSGLTRGELPRKCFKLQHTGCILL